MEARRGSYTWTYRQKDGTNLTVSASGAHPLQERPQEKLLLCAGMDTAWLQWEIAPDQVSGRCWSEEQWKMIDAESDEVPVEMHYIDLADHANQEAARISLRDETCIYEIIAEWNGSAAYSGTVQYSFCAAKA